MSIAALNWAFEQPIVGAAKAVLIVLADHVDQDGWCWPTIGRLCFRSGFAERTVRIALRELERAGLILAQIGAGRGRVSRYQVLHNHDAQPEAPAKRTNGHDEAPQKGQQMPLYEPKGAADAPISAPVKGAVGDVKGAKSARKGAAAAPKPLRTTKKNHQGGRARAREAPPTMNVYDQIQAELGMRSLLLPPLPEHNPSARQRMIQ